MKAEGMIKGPGGVRRRRRGRRRRMRRRRSVCLDIENPECCFREQRRKIDGVGMVYCVTLGSGTGSWSHRYSCLSLSLLADVLITHPSVI